MSAAIRWYPPRGSVTISRVPLELVLHEADCGACFQTFRSVKTGCQEWKRNHTCPPGTDGALPQCPSCGSKSKRCKRASGWDADGWHAERRDAYDTFVGP